MKEYFEEARHWPRTKCEKIAACNPRVKVRDTRGLEPCPNRLVGESAREMTPPVSPRTDDGLSWSLQETPPHTPTEQSPIFSRWEDVETPAFGMEPTPCGTPAEEVGLEFSFSKTPMTAPASPTIGPRDSMGVLGAVGLSMSLAEALGAPSLARTVSSPLLAAF